MIKRLSVPDQLSDNFLKMTTGDSPCCGDNLTVCEYDVTYTQSNTVSLLNITEGGVARALPCVPATTSAADVKAAILAALVAAGYEDSGEGTGVTVVDNGTTLTVTILGDVVAVSLTHSGGTATFNQDCTKLGLCTFTLAAITGGTTNNMRINGVNNALGTITPGTTSAATVKTAVEGALTAQGVSGTVAVVASGTDYTVTITLSEIDNTMQINNAYFAKSACAQFYV